MEEKAQETPQVSMETEALQAYLENKYGPDRWWEGTDATEMARRQLYEDFLAIPFSMYHEGLEKLLGRSVLVPEIANSRRLQRELEGEVREYERVSLSTLAATNGYISNVFITARLFFYDFGVGWLQVESVKPSPAPGKIIVVLSDGDEQETHANYGFRLRLV